MSAVTRFAEVCPECGGQWERRDGDGQPLGVSSVIAHYDWGADRTVAWHCPHCRYTFTRDSPAVLR